uniref:NAC domain-containing protein n=1 Tax=Oryza punctata TaxID=4537 RepID=A0A0E0JT05_ORYPU
MAVVTAEAAGGGGGGGYRMVQAGLPIGFRFRPTDEELLLHYLRRKVMSCPLPADVIPVADLARTHPWDLLPGDGDGERYFFHKPATSCWRRGGGGSRAAGGDGVWRASGKEKLVVAPRCKRPVGAKRTLVFFRRGGARTDWAMHEYRLLPAALHAAADDHPPEANDWVVCRIFKKTTPAHRRSPPCIRGTPRRRAAAAADDMPSSPSSCVTDGGDMGEEGEESSSCSVVASNCP